MAGGGGGLQGPERGKRGKSSKRKKMKRLGFRLDMTPLVDITFLLLTFFMFTTTMLKPQVMEMHIPPETTDIQVKASELLTIMLRNDGKIFWYAGKASPDNKPEQIDIKKIKDLAVEQNLKPNVRNKLITVLKVENDASYNGAVEILDQLNQAEIPITEQLTQAVGPDGQPMKRERKFTIAAWSDQDTKDLEGL